MTSDEQKSGVGSQKKNPRSPQAQLRSYSLELRLLGIDPLIHWLIGRMLAQVLSRRGGGLRFFEGGRQGREGGNLKFKIQNSGLPSVPFLQHDGQLTADNFAQIDIPIRFSASGKRTLNAPGQVCHRN